MSIWKDGGIAYDQYVANDAFLPAQMDHGSKYRQYEGERLLCWSVFVDAARCSQYKGTRGKPLQKKLEAVAWFYSESRYPFSYLWICEMLELEPVALRAQVLHGTWTLPRTRPVMSKNQVLAIHRRRR